MVRAALELLSFQWHYHRYKVSLLKYSFFSQVNFKKSIRTLINPNLGEGRVGGNFTSPPILLVFLLITRNGKSYNPGILQHTVACH